MMVLLAIATYLAQNPVPDSVTNEAVSSWSKGGFQAVAAVLAAGIIGVFIAARWLIKRADERADKAEARADKERDANAKSADALMNLAEKTVEAATKGEAATREQTGAINTMAARSESAINALAQEVRARGDSRGPG